VTWVKLDDGFYDNPKIEAAGLAAAGLYAKSLAYCGRHLTDGFVPKTFVKAHGTRAAATRLEHVGLWKQDGDGWYIEFNFTREYVLDRRAKDLARKRQNGHHSERNPAGIQPESEWNDL
jgi:hypothetical protein